MTEIITRVEAKAQGLKHYYTGEPCKYRQIAVRDVSNGNCHCFICRAKKTYANKKWRANNRERSREIINASAKRRRIKPQ